MAYWDISVYCTFWEWGNVTTPLVSIQFLLYYLSTGHIREVKHNRKFQPVSSKSGCGGLREVVAYKMFQKYWFDLEMFGILENWWLRRGGHLRFDCVRKHFSRRTNQAGKFILTIQFTCHSALNGTPAAWSVHYLLVDSQGYTYCHHRIPEKQTTILTHLLAWSEQQV